MSARKKLNSAVFNGIVIISVLVGLWTRSPLLCLTTLVALVGEAIYNRDIRFGSERRRQHAPRQSEPVGLY